MVDQTGYTTNYIYDAAGRLSELTDGSSNPIVTYTYDTVGRLSKKTNGNGTYTSYTYDADGNVVDLINYSASNAVQSSFVYTYNAVGERSVRKPPPQAHGHIPTTPPANSHWRFMFLPDKARRRRVWLIPTTRSAISRKPSSMASPQPMSPTTSTNTLPSAASPTLMMLTAISLRMGPIPTPTTRSASSPASATPTAPRPTATMLSAS